MRKDALCRDNYDVPRASVGVGDNITDALASMLSVIGDVKTITVAEISAAPRMQSRLARPRAAEALLDIVDKERASNNLPFWDAVLLALSYESPSVRDDVLTAALFHQRTAETPNRESLPVDPSLSRMLAARAAQIRTGRILVASSLVELTSGTRWHVPMLDFRVPPTPANQIFVCELVRHLGLGGWILESGRSYHFYGATLVDTEQFRAFLGRALLFQPVVDARWVAHQLVEGAAALRISRGGPFQITPRIVHAIYP